MCLKVNFSKNLFMDVFSFSREALPVISISYSVSFAVTSMSKKSGHTKSGLIISHQFFSGVVHIKLSNESICPSK